MLWLVVWMSPGCGPDSGLDEPGLEVGVAAGASQQQVLLVDQAVQQVLLSVVVVDFEEGDHRDAQPGQPGGPQTELSYSELIVESGVIETQL